MTRASEIISALDGKTLATAESCTGGMVGAALTAVPGSSKVYKGGIVSYWSEIKHSLLGVDKETLAKLGPVSAQVAVQMAKGARRALDADVAVSVTGLAGPGGDDFGNPVGTVFLGYADDKTAIWEEHHFTGDREVVRAQAAEAALALILKNIH